MSAPLFSVDLLGVWHLLRCIFEPKAPMREQKSFQIGQGNLPMSINGSDIAASDPTRQFFRHILATIAYRGGKTLRSAPESFATFRIAETSRTPAQILAHMGDLVEWTYRQVRGEQWLPAWHPVGPSTWDADVARFFKALEQVDNALATEQSSATTLEVLFQGPVSDVLTHIGQLGMLRRVAGSPIKGEVMVIADVQVGRVGLDQAAPKREFE